MISLFQIWNRLRALAQLEDIGRRYLPPTEEARHAQQLIQSPLPRRVIKAVLDVVRNNRAAHIVETVQIIHIAYELTNTPTNILFLAPQILGIALTFTGVAIGEMKMQLFEHNVRAQRISNLVEAGLKTLGAFCNPSYSDIDKLFALARQGVWVSYEVAPTSIIPHPSPRLRRRPLIVRKTIVLHDAPYPFKDTLRQEDTPTDSLITTLRRTEPPLRVALVPLPAYNKRTIEEISKDASSSSPAKRMKISVEKATPFDLESQAEKENLAPIGNANGSQSLLADLGSSISAPSMPAQQEHQDLADDGSHIKASTSANIASSASTPLLPAQHQSQDSAKDVSVLIPPRPRGIKRSRSESDLDKLEKFAKTNGEAKQVLDRLKERLLIAQMNHAAVAPILPASIHTVVIPSQNNDVMVTVTTTLGSTQIVWQPNPPYPMTPFTPAPMQLHDQEDDTPDAFPRDATLGGRATPSQRDYPDMP